VLEDAEEEVNPLFKPTVIATPSYRRPLRSGVSQGTTMCACASEWGRRVQCLLLLRRSCREEEGGKPSGNAMRESFDKRANWPIKLQPKRNGVAEQRRRADKVAVLEGSVTQISVERRSENGDCCGLT
jgi:hypothetical protein